MEIASIEVLPEGSDAAVRVYREVSLTIWATLPSPVVPCTVRGSGATVALKEAATSRARKAPAYSPPLAEMRRAHRD